MMQALNITSQESILLQDLQERTRYDASLENHINMQTLDASAIQSFQSSVQAQVQSPGVDLWVGFHGASLSPINGWQVVVDA